MSWEPVAPNVEVRRLWPFWRARVWTRMPELCVFVTFLRFSRPKVIARAERFARIEWPHLYREQRPNPAAE